MKRFGFLLTTTLLLLFFISIIVINGCGKPEPVQEEQPVVVTLPVQEEKPTPPPPPPPPPPKLKAEQLQTVYFDFDKFNLRSDAKLSLDANYQLLNEFPDAIIKIEGHCDERGTVEYNISLGEKRARAVMEYLVGLGIKSSRISIISFGKERPVDTGHNEAAWAKNRRAEFRIISQ